MKLVNILLAASLGVPSAFADTVEKQFSYMGVDRRYSPAWDCQVTFTLKDGAWQIEATNFIYTLRTWLNTSAMKRLVRETQKTAHAFISQEKMALDQNDSLEFFADSNFLPIKLKTIEFYVYSHLQNSGKIILCSDLRITNAFPIGTTLEGL